MVLVYADAKSWGRNGYGWIHREGSVYATVTPLRRLKEETAFPEPGPGDWDFLFKAESLSQAEEGGVWRPSEPIEQLPSRGGVNLLGSGKDSCTRNILRDLLAGLTRFWKGI